MHQRFLLYSSSLSSCSYALTLPCPCSRPCPTVTTSIQPTLDLFPRELITVLSPDAAEPLTDLDPARVYVVGGIVDKSVIRGVTAGFAVRTAGQSC